MYFVFMHACCACVCTYIRVYGCASVCVFMYACVHMCERKCVCAFVHVTL